MERNYILFDDNRRENLLPLTFTRPVAEIRVGILTITEKWKYYLGKSCSFLTKNYLSEKYPLNTTETEFLLINGGICPDENLVKAIGKLNAGEALISENCVIAGVLRSTPKDHPCIADFYNTIIYNHSILQINNPWDIFKFNGEAIERDFELLTKNRKSEPIPSTNTVLNPSRVFIEKGARVECSILNAETGPIYIAKDAEIMEGSIVRGPFALGEHSALKMGAKIYGPTTVGPHSKVGGEVNNSVIFGYSNKAHDGFLGNSVIGEWCNLGADTNNSNLKNNYAEVKLWNYPRKSFIKTGLQFCGLIMGDHSKCGINTMFNTGTVVGVSANIFGSGFPRNFIPCFSWGGASGFSIYQPSKAFETAKIVMSRREIELTEIDKKILLEVFEQTNEFRNF
ncbi:glucose-1-phosphate thymidylyltransferase [Tenuifilaceae bacterium CYCD]|nr:glucose-1-phosphate thymidylyltransferase [Tenuifilaceae bacterium CYCD]